MKIQEIMDNITRIRKSKKRVVTNYYLSCRDSDEDFVTWTGRETIVFLAEEERLQRCYFASADEEELCELLGRVPKDVVMDVITKEKPDTFSWVENGSFEHYSTLARHTVPDLDAPVAKTKSQLLVEEYYDPSVGEFAVEKDADEIYEMLYRIFDFRISRLPTRDELLEMIAKKWVLLHRESGAIVSFYMYQVEGRKFYAYQIYNEGTGDIAYDLECKAMNYAKENYGVTNSYAWIEVDNKAANKRAGNNNNYDGTYDYIFLKK